MGGYDFSIHANVTGAESVDKLTVSASKVADVQKKNEEAIKAYLLKHDEWIQKAKTAAEQEARINQLREQYWNDQKKRFEQEEAAWRRMQQVQEQAQKENIARNNALGKSNEELAANIKNFIQNPLSAAGSAAESFVLQYGKVGVAAVGAGAAIAVAGGFAIKAAMDVGRYAQETSNLAERIGLTTTETQLYSHSAEIAGVHAGTLTIAMRTLSRGLSENSEEGKKQKLVLAELGIEGNAAFRPMGEILPEIFKKLADVGNVIERDRMTITLFGRSGLEMAPLFKNFKEFEDRVKAAGLVLDEQGIKKGKEFEEEMILLGLRWDHLKLKLGEKVIAPIEFVIKYAGPANKGIFQTLGPLGMGLETDRQITEFIEQYFSKVAGPNAPAPPSILSGTQLQDQQRQARQSVLYGYDQTHQDRTAKLKAELESLDTERTQATNRFMSGKANEPDTIKELSRIDARIKAVKEEEKAIKDQAKAISETEKLRQELAKSLEKELTGIEKINAAYQERLRHLQQEGMLTGANLVIAQQIRDAEAARFQQQLDIARSGNQRREGTVRYEAERKQAQLEGRGTSTLMLAIGRATGEEAERPAAKAAYQERRDAAQAEFELDQRHIADLRAASAEREQTGHDQIKLESELSAIRNAETVASGKRQALLYQAALEYAEKLLGLDKKDRDEKESTAKAEVDNQRRIEDAYQQGRERRIRDEAQRGIRMIEAGALPGHEVTTSLQVEQAKIRAAQVEYELNEKHLQQEREAAENLPERTAKQREARAAALNRVEVEGIKNEDDLYRQIDDARMERQIKLLQLQKEELQKYQQMAGSLFDALRGHSTGQWFRELAIGQEKQIFTNLATPVLQHVGQTIGGMIPGQTDAQGNLTGIGRLLSGTMLSSANADPAKQTADNTKSTVSEIIRLQGIVKGIFTGNSDPNAPLTAAGGQVNPMSLPYLFGSDLNGITGQLPGGGSGTSGIGGLLGLFGLNSGTTGGIGSSLFNAGSGSLLTQLFSGFGGGGSNPLGAIFNGTSTNGNVSTELTGAQRVGAGIGTAATLGTEAYSAYQGFSKGGAKGALQGTSGILSMAATVDPEPISKMALAAAAAVTGMISSIMGDPVQIRQKAIANELQKNQYLAPTALNVTQSPGGTYADFDARGNLRTSTLSAVPTVAEPYITSRVLQGQRQYYDVPGGMQVPYTGGAAGTGQTPVSNAPQQTIIIKAMDAQSFHEWLQHPKNSMAVGEALATHLQSHEGRASNAIRFVAGS